MYLEGKVQTAKVGVFFDSLELDVIDRQAVKPSGGRPQYKCRLVSGWPGIAEMKELKKSGADAQQLENLVATIQLPQEDQVLPLHVVDMAGKGQFKVLVCELLQQSA